MSDAGASSALCILAREATLHTGERAMPRDAKPVLVIGSLNMDLVAGCELLPGTSQTVFGRELLFQHSPGQDSCSNTI